MIGQRSFLLNRNRPQQRREKHQHHMPLLAELACSFAGVFTINMALLTELPAYHMPPLAELDGRFRGVNYKHFPPNGALQATAIYPALLFDGSLVCLTV
jgi:hypothetical protein